MQGISGYPATCRAAAWSAITRARRGDRSGRSESLVKRHGRLRCRPQATAGSCWMQQSHEAMRCHYGGSFASSTPDRQPEG